MFRQLKKLLLLAFALLPTSLAAQAEKTAGFSVKDLGDRVRVEKDNKLVVEYRYKDVPRPFFYPVIGPTGVNITRHYPMVDNVEGEPRDHRHHKGLWFTHGAVNGVDFWTDGDTKGKIVHEKLEIPEPDGGPARFTTVNSWTTPDGKKLLTDERGYKIRKLDNGAVEIHFDIKLTAGDEEITLGDTKEGSFAIRLPKSMQLKDGEGHIVNSEGIKDGETWGKQATWVDYYGPLEGKTVGVAIFDHPENPRHPTWWHVRDYGLFAANPFGQHDFEKKPAGTGDLKVPARESVRFRYCVLLHEGDAEQAGIAGKYKEYAGAAQ